MTLFLLLLDLLAIAITGVAALLLRDNLDLSVLHFTSLQPYLVSSLISAAVVLPVLGVNHSVWRYSSFNDFIRVGLAVLLIVLVSTMAAFGYNRLEGVARAIPILHGLLIFVLMCALRAVMRLLGGWWSHARASYEPVGIQPGESVLVIGVNPVAGLFIYSVRDMAKPEIRVVGVLAKDPRHQHRGRRFYGVPVLGGIGDVRNVLRQLEVHGVSVGRIVVAVAASQLSAQERDVLALIESGSDIVIDYLIERVTGLPSAVPLARPAAPTADEEPPPNPLPSLTELVVDPCLARPYWRRKRFFDFAVSLALIIAGLPLALLVAAAVALDVGLPLLFWQERPGVFGRKLRLYKFRTMRSAHDVHGRVIPDAQRSSPIGRFLRRSRLDEIPQLFHILIGEMSFIGPRPLLLVDQSTAHSGRLAVKPGLTGWAQVHGGRNVTPADKAAMDICYIKNASFQLDMLIIVKTVRMLARGDIADDRAIAAAWRDARAWYIRTAR